jgi:hypothetical protein
LSFLINEGLLCFAWYSNLLKQTSNREQISVLVIFVTSPCLEVSFSFADGAS